MEINNMESKPEWFQLTDEDRFVPRPPVKRVARLMALASPLLILGTGFLVAQGGENQNAAATQSTVLASAQNPSKSNNSIEVASAVATPKTISAISTSNHLAAPSVFPAITKPTGGADDDGDGDGDD